MNDALDAAIAALNAERYGPSLWWKSKLEPAVLDDSETATARRRRHMAEDFASLTEEKVS